MSMNTDGVRQKADKIQLCNVWFSKKELDVLALIYNGCSHKCVANLLGLPMKTVDAHVRNIVSRSGCMSLEHLNSAIAVSGACGYLHDIYVRLLYQDEFDDFISSYRVSEPLSVMICFGMCDAADIEKIKDIFLKVGCAFVEINTSNVDSSFKKIWVKNKADTSIEEEKFDYVMDMERDGLFLSVLKCLFALTNDRAVSIQVDRYAVMFQNNKNDNIKKFGCSWSKKMNRYVGLAGAACCSIFIAGYLYGTYPRMNEVITNQELSFVNKDFYKREGLIGRINTLLARDNNVNVVTLVGPGGAGKTTLARMIMNDFGRNSDVAYELNVESHKALVASLEKLCVQLAGGDKGLAEQFRGIASDKDEKKKFSRMIHFMKDQLKRKKHWLLVLDNLEAPEVIYSFMPIEKDYKDGKILITTRDQAISQNKKLGNNAVIDVGELQRLEKYALFNKVASNSSRRKNYSRKEIDLLLSQVPNYPLDVASVACCISGSSMTPEEYLKNMNFEISNFNEVDNSLMYDLTSYGKTRYGIIVTTLDNILNEIKGDSLMKGALLVLSMCDSQNIPDKLFERFGNENDFKNRLFNLLQKYSFITKGKDGTSIHRVIQDMWFKLLSKKLSSSEIENALTVFIDKVIKFDEVMHMEHGNNLIQADREYYAKLAPTLLKFADLVDKLPVTVSEKMKYRAKAMALGAYVIREQKLYGGTSYFCSIFEKVFGIDDQYHVLKRIERAMMMYEYSFVVRNVDLDKSWKLLDDAEKVADETSGGIPFQIMCNVVRSQLYSMKGDYENALKVITAALNLSFDMRNKHPTEFWPKKLYGQTKYYQLMMNLGSKLNDYKLAEVYVGDFTSLLDMFSAVDVKNHPLKQNEVSGLVPLLKKCMVDLCNRAEMYEKAALAYQEAKYVYEKYPCTAMGVFLVAEALYCDTLLRVNNVNAAYKLAKENYQKMIKFDASKNDMLFVQSCILEACVRLEDYSEALELAKGIGTLRSSKNQVIESYARCMFSALVAAIKCNDNKNGHIFCKNLFLALRKLANQLLDTKNIKDIESVLDASNYGLETSVKNAQKIFNSIYGDHIFVHNYISSVRL